MKVHGHGQRQTDLNHGRCQDEFVEIEPGAHRIGHCEGADLLGPPRPQLHGFGQEPHFDTKLRHSGCEVQVAIRIAEIIQRSGPWAGRPLDQRNGEGPDECHSQKRKLETRVQQLLRVQH